MSSVIMIGLVATDIEPYTTQNGVSRSSFKIAVQRRFKNAEGKHDADFFSVVAWRTTADFCNKYLKKGQLVAVEGTLQNRQYDAKDGSKRFITEINAEQVSGYGGGNGDSKGNTQHKKPQEQPDDSMPNGFEEVDDSDLPF